MTDSKKILVVDDETQIMRVMRQILSAHQFSVRTASDGKDALDIFKEWQPDLIITDLQMPQMGGLELCRRLRRRSAIPLLVLSVRDDEISIVEALDAGADDYVKKPFGTNELLARVRSLLRRQPEKLSDLIEVGDFKIDLASHKVIILTAEIRLSPKEFELLAFLANHPEKTLTHSTLLKGVWGGYYTEQPEALRVLVGSLRKKIEKDSAQPQYLLTEPWIGYRFKPTA